MEKSDFQPQKMSPKPKKIQTNTCWSGATNLFGKIVYHNFDIVMSYTPQIGYLQCSIIIFPKKTSHGSWHFEYTPFWDKPIGPGDLQGKTKVEETTGCYTAIKEPKELPFQGAGSITSPWSSRNRMCHFGGTQE
jgi:hypothetical protein